jgi:hypothetical protein
VGFPRRGETLRLIAPLHCFCAFEWGRIVRRDFSRVIARVSQPQTLDCFRTSLAVTAARLPNAKYILEENVTSSGHYKNMKIMYSMKFTLKSEYINVYHNVIYQIIIK